MIFHLNYKKKYSIILVSHGSKKKFWKKIFLKIKYNFKKKNFFLNKNFISYLNIIKPNIIKKVNKLIKLKYKKCLMILFFISLGKHILIDIIKIIKNLLKIYKNIKIFYLKKLLEFKKFSKNLLLFLNI